jgi:endonuclease YncB( thermonuclease family)
MDTGQLIRSMPLRLAPVVLAAVLSLASTSSAAETVTYTGRASVIDGDTVEIRGKRIRLFGIDAVESSQRCQREGRPWRCGKDSAFALANKIGERRITCSGNEFDRYKRLVARCSLNGVDLGGWMVENGWAVAFRKYSDLYVEREARAREKRIGLWSGEFQMPWEWRSSRQKPREQPRAKLPHTMDMETPA